MGINIGALIAPLACGYVGQMINWNLGFMLAGAGMVLGLVQFVLGARYLGEAGLRPAAPISPRRRGPIAAASIAVAAGVPLLALSGFLHITAAEVGDAAGVVLIALTIGIYARLLSSREWTPVERRRFLAIAVLFLASALFFSAFEQAGSTLNLFAARSTRDRILGLAFPSTWFQSLNPLFIVLLAPGFAWLWIRLGGREPSTPVKFALGLLLVGAGFVVIAFAAARAASGVLVSPLWLLATYFLHTCGELCLSPVGLSAMTKLAPARVASLVMGVWFLSISVGDYIGGRFASVYGTFSPASLFATVAAFTVAVGLALGALAKPVKRLMGGVT
jgi:POT family proton-dependent oligopeptide transporter